MPDLLISISSMQNSSFEEILKHASSFKNPASIPFKISKDFISKGMPASIAISTAFSKHSIVVKKTGELFSKLYSNGNSLLPLLKEFALELSQYNAVKEQAKADSSLQKYTLLVSSSFLVPFIIALIHSVSLRASLLLSSVQVQSEVILLAINLYLLILSFLSAKFISRQFSTHFITFFSITAPISLLVFNLASFFLE